MNSLLLPMGTQTKGDQNASFSVYHNDTEGLLKHGLLTPTPDLLIQRVWDGTQEFTFLTSF